jgi:TIR domain-containing protein
MKIHGSEGSETERIFAVSVAPPTSLDVEYYGVKELSLYVTNRSAQEQLLDSVTLKFQPDVGTAPIYVRQSCGLSIAIGKAAEVKLRIRPTPLYQENTNAMSVMLEHRACDAGRLGSPGKEIHSDCFYLIIKPSADDLGEIFISFKQPEDLPLAEALARYARRAGFKPYIAQSKPELGADQWNRIESAIARSTAIVIMWTVYTEWGGGVKKEIELARKYKIKEVLLLANNIDVPALYKGTDIEFKKFDPSNPAPSLVEAITSMRNQIVSSS